MITLYHGSTQIIEHPLANVGRSDLDFGKGFYVTTLRNQAERWATRMQLIHAKDSAWVNIYEFDEKAAFATERFRLLRFESYDRQWLDFIVASRNGRQPWKGFDAIEGGVANDQVIDTVEDYINGSITAEQALGQLVYAKPNHQMCLLSQSLIDNCLCYIDSVQLSNNVEKGGK